MIILLLPLFLLIVMVFTLHVLYNDIISNRDIVGLKGIAVSYINRDGGVVLVNKKYIIAKTYFSKINNGNYILIVGYDEDSKKYLVEDYN
jgi:membrane-bound ClpP family serine protease